ncbi:uncharacterized protein E5676_scaffold234G00900 [Cucumis melo var. makuwa]|uniref:Uncharacterized protein n=1 Tax=Cucumis melo var. makuwa TaxID=1194695 RepID=A0A5A7TEC7_CUCMM|nr:uncharacterized protein E6C27_scaffold93G001270 [Cucumis melo var. makuwa]TYJ97978.1 uncharacterized protein E5676_scaffold234G00900 [Cucumis melo var. makuwa]
MFPPAFFNVMVYLIVHLPYETKATVQFLTVGCIPLKEVYTLGNSMFEIKHVSRGILQKQDEVIGEFEIFKQKVRPLGYKDINTSRFGVAEESNKHIWDMPEVDDIENEQLNVLEIIVGHRVDEHMEDDTLYRIDVDPTIVERSVVRHVTNDFIDDGDEQLSHESGTSNNE